jgi:hypothetical protein
MSLVATEKGVAELRGTDFSKTASKNQLKKALAKAVGDGALLKEGTSYGPPPAPAGPVKDTGGEWTRSRAAST